MDEPTVTTLLCDLNEHALIRVSGADAREFLQGQLSNDATQVSPTQSQWSSLNTPQGRTLALMRLFELEGELMLALPSALQAPVIGRLRKYILRSQVTLEPANDLMVRCGIAGESAAAVLQAVGITPPASVDAATVAEGTTIIQVNSTTGSRFELYGSGEKALALRKVLAEHCEQADANQWLLFDTLAGVPHLEPVTSGEFLPQMLNLDQLGAINFKKGCYAGQEIIARTHYRGQVKRRLKLIFDGDSAAPGQSVTFADGFSATVVQCAPHPDGGFALLAVAPVETMEKT
ncbi:MAG TPA: folate-binding protein [Gammaproteobacteria bacterium]|nr:folate-binding protein [Gammaproteobacteria bacterium]